MCPCPSVRMFVCPTFFVTSMRVTYGRVTRVSGLESTKSTTIALGFMPFFLHSLQHSFLLRSFLRFYKVFYASRVHIRFLLPLTFLSLLLLFLLLLQISLFFLSSSFQSLFLLFKQREPRLIALLRAGCSLRSNSHRCSQITSRLLRSKVIRSRFC